MRRCMPVALAIGLAGFVPAACDVRFSHETSGADSPSVAARDIAVSPAHPPPATIRFAAASEVEPPLSRPQRVPLRARIAMGAVNSTGALSHESPGLRLQGGEPMVIGDCRLVVTERQEVPSQRDGVLLAACTELRPGEAIPADRLISVRVDDKERRFRRLREGDAVEAGQLVALLDDRLARDNCALKRGQVALSQADLEAAEKARDEAKERYLRQLKLHSAAGGPATSDEDVGGAQLTWYKNHYDAVSKREAIALAQVELHQAQTVLGMYEIRTAIPGIVKAIHKNPGEAVKTFEPLVEIWNPRRLRVEGLVGVQHLPRLHTGFRAQIEPCPSQGPRQRFEGHLGEVTSVAIARDAIVSGSEDGTVRVWDPHSARERRVLRPPAAVRSVACTPASAAANLCLVGTADGSAWIWNLDSPPDEPARELKGQHGAALNGVAFSADGKCCATGGDDHGICLWDVASGSLRYRFPSGHLGAVTWLQFAGPARLVSAGRDNTLRVWSLGNDSASLEMTFDHRSGDVPHLSVSADGKRVLLDQGNTLHVLSLDGAFTEAVVRSRRATVNFTTFAAFSPTDGRILTAGQSEGRLQLWESPADAGHVSEIRELVPPDHSPATCAAFAPDGSFVVTGTRDRQVLLWDLPAAHESIRRYPAELTLVERVVESNAQQVRVWAELANPDTSLIPGTSVTMTVFPEN